MFKKKFNYKEGEKRECIVCTNIFETFKPRWKCDKCLAEHIYQTKLKNVPKGIIKTGKFEGQEYKKAYPFSTRTHEAIKRFNRIKRELNKCTTKEERRAHYQKQLEEIKHNGIWEWIFDRRDDESIREKKGKSKLQTITEYPDLRGYYEE
jgi:translation initiation factor 2B subunit (eIF-2B alpha/beta/delta family)